MGHVSEACLAGLLLGTAAHGAPGDPTTLPEPDRAAVQAQLQIILETAGSGTERSFRTPLAVVSVTPFQAFSRRSRAPCGNCGDPCRPYRMQYQPAAAQEIPIIEGARCRTADGRWVALEERIVGMIDLRPKPPPAPPAPLPVPPAPTPPPPAPTVESARPPQPPEPPPPWRPDPEAVGLLESLRYLDGGATRLDRPRFEGAVAEFARDRNLSASPAGPSLVDALHNAAVREFALASCVDDRMKTGAVCRR